MPGHVGGASSPEATGDGHYLDDIDGFDPDLFGLDDRTAALLDPQERLLLHSAWQALESAGHAGARLDATGRSVGVYLAVTSRDYAVLTGGRGPQGDPAGRLSRLLDLRGPSQNVDTGPSSFLTALHHALAALRAGECAAALVGTAELRLDPARPGDGEGVAAVLLKPLAAARADGDHVHAVLLSSAVGHPGRGPHAPLRERLTQHALAAARVPAPAVALAEDARSVAASVGRAGPATGAAALTRAVLQLRHATLLPAPAAPDGGGRAQPTAWPAAPTPRRALVGVHDEGAPQATVLLEEAPRSAPQPDGRAEPAPGPRLVLLSAPTPAHLSATAARLARWLTAPAGAARGAACDLDAVAGELRAGRAAMSCRLAVVASDVPALASALAAFAAPARPTAPPGAPVPLVRTADLRAAERDPLLLGALDETRAYIDALWRGGRLEQLTRLWLAGVDVLVPDRSAPAPASAPASASASASASAPPTVPGPRPVVELPTTVPRPRPLWCDSPPRPARSEPGALG
ncbi:polyketide synthase [Streptomyces sp. G-G2]|uniref:beta-ketoacyl [acyl carrier protein] synthase domain-containing protein n=1 Tax=Streptomyces sp. G-G2 TaxID=3046201 RepID=UPI0024BA15E4|nr:polyketide synthase [Streptomyces sp. G-G2]MDJ0384716.1 polyketide synthase [Streptomyces sp. G-G2]